MTAGTPQERVASVLTAEMRLINCGAPLVDAFGKRAVTVDLEPSFVYHVQLNDDRVDVCYANTGIVESSDIVLGEKVVTLVTRRET